MNNAKCHCNMILKHTISSNLYIRFLIIQYLQTLITNTVLFRKKKKQVLRISR